MSSEERCKTANYLEQVCEAVFHGRALSSSFARSFGEWQRFTSWQQKDHKERLQGLSGSWDMYAEIEEVITEQWWTPTMDKEPI